MSLLRKIFGKNEKNLEPTYLKDEIYIYAEILQEPILKENKDYVIAGVYNEDKTQFIDFVNDRVYTFEKPCEDFEVLELNERKMFKIGNSIKSEMDRKVYGVIRLKTNTKYEVSGFDWVKEMRVGVNYKSDSFDWIVSPESKEFSLYLEFLFRQGNAKVKQSEIKSIAQALNNYAYDAVSLEIFEQNNNI